MDVAVRGAEGEGRPGVVGFTAAGAGVGHSEMGLSFIFSSESPSCSKSKAALTVSINSVSTCRISMMKLLQGEDSCNDPNSLMWLNA